MTSFDQLFRRLILTQSFVRGWGNPLHLKEIFTFRREKIGVRDECSKLVPAESIHENTVEILKQETKGDRLYINARFRSPLAEYLPHMVRDSVQCFLQNNAGYTRFQRNQQQPIFN